MNEVDFLVDTERQRPRCKEGGLIFMPYQMINNYAPEALEF